MRMSELNKSFKFQVSSFKLKTKLVPLFFVLATCNLQLATFSFADEYHYNNILIGDRAAAMGGAYTAISDDSSGCYYNPAGIVYATGRSLSVSVNALHITNTRYKGVIGGNDWERRSSAFQPNFFGIIQPLGKGKVGFSYAVTDSVLEDQDQKFNNVPGVSRYLINFNKKDITYNLGPSYARELWKGLSVGATLYAHYRENEWILNLLKQQSTGDYWSNKYYETSEFGIRPIIGLMWSPMDKLSVGLSMTQTKVLYSETTDQLILKQTTSSTVWPPSSNEIIKTDYDKRELPLTTTLGVAYFASDSFLVSGDFTYYDRTTDKFFGNREATWNAALGTEYYLTDRLALRAGMFTNRANTSEIATGDVNKLDHVDLYGGSLSLTRFTRQSSLTLGGSYSFGSGKAQVGENAADIQDAEIQNLTAFVSAGYSY